jgi:hypothetical protein
VCLSQVGPLRFLRGEQTIAQRFSLRREAADQKNKHLRDRVAAATWNGLAVDKFYLGLEALSPRLLEAALCYSGNLLSSDWCQKKCTNSAIQITVSDNLSVIVNVYSLAQHPARPSRNEIIEV